MLLKRWVLLLGGLLNGSELIAQPLSLALESSGLPLLTSCVPLLPSSANSSASPPNFIFRIPHSSSCMFKPIFAMEPFTALTFRRPAIA